MKRRLAKFALFRIKIVERYGQPTSTEDIFGQEDYLTKILFWLKNSNSQSCNWEHVFYHVIHLTVAENQA